ncbi:MAG TPA: hypothetical protein VF765_08850 [Polyangiaceae bacterium]
MTVRSSRALLLPLLVASLALAASASGVSACAAQGQGTNETFADAADESAPEASVGATGSSSGSSGTSSGTTGSSSGTTGSSSGASGSSGGAPTGSSSGSQAGGSDASVAADVQTGGACDANTMTDPFNCGQCGMVCPQPSGSQFSATPVCVAGVCTFTCAGDAGADGGNLMVCPAGNGASGCFDPRTSVTSCGACGNECTSGQRCLDGTCCAVGGAICGGTCADLLNDPANCGACGMSCGQGGACAAGKCVGYVTTTPAETFIDACKLTGHKAVLPNQFDWQMSNVFSLPFTFNLFGQPQTQFWIGTQGTLAFGPQDPNNPPDAFPACPSSSSSPDPTTGYPAIMPFADSNLGTGPDGVCFGQTTGTPAQFVVTWSRLNESTESDSILTFSVVLTQGTNAIDLQYKTAESAADGGLDPTVAGANASVGMQLSANVASVYSCNVSFIPQVPYAVHFDPLP